MTVARKISIKQPNQILAQPATPAKCAEDYKAGTTVRDTAEEQWQPARPRLFGGRK